MVQNSYGSHVKIFKEFIPRSVRAEESTAEGISILSMIRKVRSLMLISH